jgi:hypothetical protein
MTLITPGVPSGWLLDPILIGSESTKSECEKRQMDNGISVAEGTLTYVAGMGWAVRFE